MPKGVSRVSLQVPWPGVAAVSVGSLFQGGMTQEGVPVLLELRADPACLRLKCHMPHAAPDAGANRLQGTLGSTRIHRRRAERSIAATGLTLDLVSEMGNESRCHSLLAKQASITGPAQCSNKKQGGISAKLEPSVSVFCILMLLDEAVRYAKPRSSQLDWRSRQPPAWSLGRTRSPAAAAT